MENTIFIAVVAIISFGFVLGRLLDYLNARTWKDQLPADLDGFYDEAEYLKAKNYHKERERLSGISGTIGFIFMILFFISGGFGYVNHWILGIIDHPVVSALIFFGILGLASDILDLPFSIYGTFVIEEKYGFNKTTPKTFVLDHLKGYLLAIILGGGLLSLLLWLIVKLEADFWIVAFLAITVISFFLNMFYSSLIVPLFNKLSPLEEGELRSAIEAYAKKVDFPLTNIFVIDGSKRSTKANAFFSGMWKKKKIVLYDTLIEKHSVKELVAVLAHEVGHYKKKHVLKGFFMSSITTFIMLYIMSVFIFNKDFTNAFYINVFGGNLQMVDQPVLHINLVAFAILYEPISMIIGLLGNIFSRKHEFQADAFAIKTTNKSDLPESLKKMSVDHLSNLKPHPAYVFFHYSHPPLLNRLEAMEKID